MCREMVSPRPVPPNFCDVVISPCLNGCKQLRQNFLADADSGVGHIDFHGRLAAIPLFQECDVDIDLAVFQ